jgi:hypothetical protein
MEDHCADVLGHLAEIENQIEHIKLLINESADERTRLIAAKSLSNLAKTQQKLASQMAGREANSLSAH